MYAARQGLVLAFCVLQELVCTIQSTQLLNKDPILIDFKKTYFAFVRNVECWHQTVIKQLSYGYHTVIPQLLHSYIIQLSYSHHTVTTQLLHSYHLSVPNGSPSMRVSSRAVLGPNSSSSLGLLLNLFILTRGRFNLA